jgi:tripartite-type tricarboxylate transporter receptor subunit TctC
MYSATFVMTANADLGIIDLDDLKAYGANHTCIVAVNGIAGSEAFIAKAMFKELGIDLTLVSYNGANLALAAVAKGETEFALSHQS